MITRNLKKVLGGLLEEHCETVYYERADQEAGYPYTVYELYRLNEQDSRITYQLEVNILGYDVAALEDIADQIQAALNDNNYINDRLQFISYAGSRQNVQEEEENLRRRRILFSLYAYERSEE